jgi:hypothetical protein
VDTLREKEEMHGPILGAAILPPMPVARGSGSGNEREGNGEGQGLEMGILCVSFLCFFLFFFLSSSCFCLSWISFGGGGRQMQDDSGGCSENERRIRGRERGGR